MVRQSIYFKKLETAFCLSSTNIYSDYNIINIQLIQF